jgi:hypothetical protein
MSIFTGYMERGEMMRLCLGFLEFEAPLSTRQFSERAMKASGQHAGDKVLGKAVAHKIVNSMRGAVSKGQGSVR